MYILTSCYMVVQKDPSLMWWIHCFSDADQYVGRLKVRKQKYSAGVFQEFILSRESIGMIKLKEIALLSYSLEISCTTILISLFWLFRNVDLFFFVREKARELLFPFTYILSSIHSSRLPFFDLFPFSSLY